MMQKRKKIVAFGNMLNNKFSDICEDKKKK